MLAFAIAVVFMIGSPGPGVLSCAGIGAAYGWGPALRFASGLCIGQLLVFFAVAAGVDALVFALPWARPILIAASFGFLMYIAAKIAFAGSNLGFVGASSSPGFAQGFWLQPINPKAYAVCTAMISGFTFLPGQYWVETITKFAILNVIWWPLHVSWIGVGVVLKRLDLAPNHQRMINFAMAAAMLLAVAIALWQGTTSR